MPSTEVKTNRYIAIIAGGSGSRLWPLSRNNFTKQFLTLIGDRSFLQMTYDRVKGICPDEKIFIITNQKFHDIVTQQLPQIPEQNIILEPAGRDTAPAIGLASYIINKLDPTALLATIGADHYLTDTEGFKLSIEASFDFIEKHNDGILTIGINPTRPDTNLGYIEMGDPVDKAGRGIVFALNLFKEKPDLETAHKFLQNWKFLWNANYFIFSTQHLIKSFEENIPATAAILKTITDKYETPDFKKTLDEEFPKCEKVAIDYAIMEKTKGNFVLPAIFGDWVDIGNWETLKDTLVVEKSKNYTNTKKHIDKDSKDILVYSSDESKLIVTFGLEDVAVVTTNDIIFISKKSKSHELKQLLEQIPEEYK